MISCCLRDFNKKTKIIMLILLFFVFIFTITSFANNTPSTKGNSNSKKERFTRLIFVNYMCSVSYSIGYRNRDCSGIKKLARRTILAYGLPNELAQILGSIMDACCIQGKTDSLTGKNSIPYTIGRVGTSINGIIRKDR